MEGFWIDLAEKVTPFSFLFPFSQPFFSNKQRGELAAATALYLGVSNAFTPLWISQGGGLPFYYYYFFNSPFMYDTHKLKNTLYKYINFKNIKEEKRQPDLKSLGKSNKVQRNKKGKNNNTIDDSFPRLILTSTNIQTGKSVTFDSNYTEIRIEHIMASAGYAIYGLPWTKIGHDYLWDGSFVRSTTPRSVMESSPGRKKMVYMSDVFPTQQ